MAAGLTETTCKKLLHGISFYIRNKEYIELSEEVNGLWMTEAERNKSELLFSTPAEKEKKFNVKENCLQTENNVLNMFSNEENTQDSCGNEELNYRSSSMTSESSNENSLSTDGYKPSLNRSDTPDSDQSFSKARSPPTKPPRRRHSDQALVSSGSSGNRSSSYLSVNQQSSVFKVNNCVDGKSGSESLPPSWVISTPSDSVQLGLKDQHESHGHDRSKLNGSPEKLNSMHRGSLPEPKVYGRHLTDSCDNVILNSLSNVNEILGNLPQASTRHTSCHNSTNSHPNSLFSPPSLFCVPPAYSTMPSFNPLLMKESKEDKCNLAKDLFFDKLASTDVMSEILNIKPSEPSKLSIHRRHHSDPLLSWQQSKATKKTTATKTGSQRSHSFMGPSSSKPFQKFTTDNFKYQQYLTVPKDPLLLAEEVRMLQDINEKLWQYLCVTQTKLDMVQRMKLPSKSEETKGPHFSDLLAEIYYAQKERDQAMEARLRIANQERDAALKQLEDLLQSIGRNTRETDSSEEEEALLDQELEKVLQDLELTHSPARILRHQETLLSKVYKARDPRKRHMSQELRMLLSERDTAVDKAKSLEDELRQWQRSSDVWQADTKQWEANLLETLCQVINERDVALAKVSELQEEIDSFHLCYNLQTSLAKDRQGNSDYESMQKQETLPTCMGDCGIRNCDSTEAEQPFSAGSDEEGSVYKSPAEESCDNDLEQLKAEIALLQEKCEEEIRARETAEENCQRLERLVNVLRKKVNGLSVGVQV